MKIYWGRRRSPEKVAASIAELERDLGMDDATVLAKVEQQKLERTSRHRGPVILSPTSPLARLHEAALMSMGPGIKWPVEDVNSVQLISASACSTNFHQVMPAPKSRVILPASVMNG